MSGRLNRGLCRLLFADHLWDNESHPSSSHLEQEWRN